MTDPIFKFQLLDVVQDRLTTLKGAVISRVRFSNGCIRYGLQPKGLNKEGQAKDVSSSDEQDLDLIKAAPKPREVPVAKLPGGPRAMPPKYGRR